MANHVSAEKRARQNEKRRMYNRMRKGAVRSAIRRVIDAVDSVDRKSAGEALNAAVSLIDRAGQRGVIHRRQAFRRISRLTAKVKGLSS